MADDKKLRDLLSFSSEQFEGMLRAAVDCYSEGEFDRTEVILAGLIALDDTDARPYKLLGSTLLLQGKDIQAEEAYESAYDLEKDDPYTLVALAEIKLKAVKLPEAIKLFEELFALDPEREHPAANRGRKLIKEFYDEMKGG